MKLKSLLAYTLTGMLGFTSCIEDEAPNAEADILQCILPEAIRTDAEPNYNLSFDSQYNAYPLHVEVKSGTDRSALAPTFELTPGATIEPASGSTQNFNRPVRYTVTSEDKQWHRTYAVFIDYPKEESMPTTFHFEKARLVNNYQELYETDANGNSLTWASGNPGYKLANSGATTDNYPTTLGIGLGRTGNCARLVTRETGSLGAMVGMPIASGNLFIGSFDLSNALGNALGATKFGTTFYHRPLRLTGYYQYKSGPRFFENGQFNDQKKDCFNLYALFYEKTDEVKVLDGHVAKNNFEHPNLVAVALIDNARESDEWVHFDLAFDYKRYGKTLDYDKLQAGGYNLAIVMASSKDGDQFQGAPGSTLLVDDLEIVYE